jgi:hypothetical protein
MGPPQEGAKDMDEHWPRLVGHFRKNSVGFISGWRKKTPRAPEAQAGLAAGRAGTVEGDRLSGILARLIHQGCAERLASVA